MFQTQSLLSAIAGAMLLIAASTPPSFAAKGDHLPLTSGSNYDRNPSVVYDGSNDIWLFFARSQMSPADRLSGAPVDTLNYDLFYMRSTNNGKTWGAATLLAANPAPPPPAQTFYGRTVAATRGSDGTIFVFWASGGDASNLYVYKKAPGAAAFTALPPLIVTDPGTLSYFNVEAVSLGTTVHVYYEHGNGSGVYHMTFDGTQFSSPALVAANASIPKVIVDRTGVFRMSFVDASAWPTVNVRTLSSPDGGTWSAPTTVVPGNGTVTNWDATLTQSADGTFHLFFAPDQGDGRQRIELKTSSDFATWSSSEIITDGTDGERAYWDYWPEGLAHGNKVSLFYTSERGLGGDPGIAHIWMTRIK